MRSAHRLVAGIAAAVLVLTGCSSGGETEADPVAAERAAAKPSSSAAAGPQDAGSATPPGERNGSGGRVPLRPGERVVEVTMPRAYRPAASGAGSDDYRCFLLDPGLPDDSFVTGLDVAPGDPEVVHHVILFRVPPQNVAAAQRVDARSPGQGWRCFGGSGLETTGASLDDAPWLGAWAPGGSGSVLEGDVGIPIEGGSRIVMQIHYNLLAGSAPDLSSARLRITDGARGLRPLETQLLPAPVELPCRPGATGRLCRREDSVLDVVDRFGARSGQVVAGLQLFCGRGAGPRAGPTQSCTTPVREPATVHGAAGHMHLLGRSIRIEVNPGKADHRTLLDIPVWDFDDQGVRPLARPARLAAGDEVRVTCTHDQGLRDQLPAFEGSPERYVVWGEGTTDEMCLGILLATRP